LSGEIPPGVALRQEALADELGVSRIPLREAIRLLSSEGLVDLLPHKGAYVSMLSLDEVREFFDMRLQLEPWLLEQACLSTTQEQLDAAAALVEAMDGASADDWGRLNWRLHENLYRAAGRPFALEVVRTIHEKSERYFRFQVVNVPIRRQAHDEHMEMIELCRRGDAAGARAAMERHIQGAAEQILVAAQRLTDDARAAV
jgi:DNA-binding GntR family transcriptional regulator